jgi:hypothetical protein
MLSANEGIACLVAEGISDHRQAGQVCPQRQRVDVFEQAMPDGMENITKIVFIFWMLN